MLEDKELLLISGGITSSLINSFVKVLNVVVDLGRNLGSSLRRLFTKTYC